MIFVPIANSRTAALATSHRAPPPSRDRMYAHTAPNVPAAACSEDRAEM